MGNEEGMRKNMMLKASGYEEETEGEERSRSHKVTSRGDKEDARIISSSRTHEEKASADEGAYLSIMRRRRG